MSSPASEALNLALVRFNGNYVNMVCCVCSIESLADRKVSDGMMQIAEVPVQSPATTIDLSVTTAL
jgi:hypothetical protein